ncbi:C4-type zinc ribbon domain-containing protein [Clostridiaceae bacterium M8S5]|nr:C4-type zinc ribbon domain-containing protein [Clostridiaceae bacterium M8S5]
MKQIKLLWEHQEKQHELTKTLKSLKQIKEDDKLENVQVELKQLEYDLITNKTQLEMKKIEIERSERKLKIINDNLGQTTQRLYSGDITDSKELIEIHKEEERLREQCDLIEEEIYLNLEKIDAYDEIIKLKQKEYTRSSENVSFLHREHIDQTTKLKEKCKELRTKLQQLNSKIEPDFIKKYNAISKMKHRAVVKVKNKSCTGCHMNIPLSTISRLKKDEVVCYCDNCGRILLYSKEPE